MDGSLNKFNKINFSKLKIFKMFISPFFESTSKKVRKIRKMSHVKIPYQKNFGGLKTLIPAARAFFLTVGLTQKFRK